MPDGPEWIKGNAKKKDLTLFSMREILSGMIFKSFLNCNESGIMSPEFQ
jgi:hypothetical protein